MGFLSPWFLGGLLALGLPVYVHLLRQHKTTPLPFSSLMFFERRTQSSVKHRRLKYLALLALRLGLLFLLALMFANPFIRTAHAPAAAGRKLMVLAVDNSFSMRSHDALNKAKQAASDALSSFHGGDQGQVIAFGTQTHLLTQAIGDVPELRAAIQNIEQSDARSSYGELARALRSIAQASRFPVEAHVFTDMQKSSMPSPFTELNVPTNVKMVLHDTGAGKQERNWYVENVNAPRAVYKAKKIRVQAVVAGTAGEPTTQTVALTLGGKTMDTKQVQVPANGRTSVEFFLNDPPYGLNRGAVTIAANDSLKEDNQFYFSLERKEPGRVLFVHESRNSRGALYYSNAMGAAVDAGFAVDNVSAEQSAGVSPQKYALVVLSDVASIPPAFEDALKQYVSGGGALLVSLGPAASVKGRVPVAGARILDSRYSSRGGDRFQNASDVDTGHPALYKTNGFEAVRFFQTAQVEQGKSRVLARLTDQTPLVMEDKIGEGRVLTFASTFDNISNDLPLHASFIPFVENSARYLSGVDQTAGNVPVDSYVELRSAKDQKTPVEVIAPDGKRALSLSESTSAKTLQVSKAGFYEIHRGNGRQELLAVNADRRESDLTPVPKETVELWQNLGAGSAGPAPVIGEEANKEQRISLWWYLAAALLVLSIIESAVGSRYLAVERQPALVKKEAA